MTLTELASEFIDHQIRERASNMTAGRFDRWLGDRLDDWNTYSARIALDGVKEDRGDEIAEFIQGLALEQSKGRNRIAAEVVCRTHILPGELDLDYIDRLDRAIRVEFRRRSDRSDA